ncbi:MAG: hypothetical protein ACM3PY_19260, partial [Omnitrophica WOR_2 bacterium]
MVNSDCLCEDGVCAFHIILSSLPIQRYIFKGGDPPICANITQSSPTPSVRQIANLPNKKNFDNQALLVAPATCCARNLLRPLLVAAVSVPDRATALQSRYPYMPGKATPWDRGDKKHRVTDPRVKRENAVFLTLPP